MPKGLWFLRCFKCLPMEKLLYLLMIENPADDFPPKTDPNLPIASPSNASPIPAASIVSAKNITHPDDQPSSSWMEYSAGDKADSGDEITEILQRMPKCFVYLNQEGALSWEFDIETCVDGDESGAEAMQLISQVSGSVLGKRLRRRLLVHIADALAAALSSKRVGEQRDFFVHARAFVEAARTESLRLTYLISAFGMSAALVLSLLAVSGVHSLNSHLPEFLVSSSLAAVGALLSVLMRFNSLGIDTYTSRFYISLGGVSRILVGALFGAVFLMFYKAELLLTVVKGEPAIAAASLLAGFSERLIPELLGSFESKLTLSDRARSTD